MGYVVMPDIGFHRDQEMSNSLRVSQNLAKPVTAKISGGENPIGNERMTVAVQHQRLINVGASLRGFFCGLVEYAYLYLAHLGIRNLGISALANKT